MPSLQEKGPAPLLNRFIALIENRRLQSQDAPIGLAARSLLLHDDIGMHGLTDPDRRDELPLQAEKGDDALFQKTKPYPETRCDRKPQQPMRNPPAEGGLLCIGFVEVEPAALQVSPGNETHLHAFATELIGPAGRRRPLYLHTSPEFACKKLLAAGESRIFTFAPAFRNRERGALHAPQFTMLEWYRAHETYDALMDDCAAILRLAAEAVPPDLRAREQGRLSLVP